MSQQIQDKIVNQKSSSDIFKKPIRVILTDDKLREQIEKKSNDCKDLSCEIKKLRNRLNARVFKAKRNLMKFVLCRCSLY